MEDAIYSLLKMLIETDTENPNGNEEALADKIIDWLAPYKPQYKKIPIEAGRCFKGNGKSILVLQDI